MQLAPRNVHSFGTGLSWYFDLGTPYSIGLHLSGGALTLLDIPDFLDHPFSFNTDQLRDNWRMLWNGQ